MGAVQEAGWCLWGLCFPPEPEILEGTGWEIVDLMGFEQGLKRWLSVQLHAPLQLLQEPRAPCAGRGLRRAPRSLLGLVAPKTGPAGPLGVLQHGSPGA